MANSQTVSTLGTAKAHRLTADSVAARQAEGVYVCIHGHFYQPPREHPALDVVSRQPGAAPFHDWNERILHESYRPNAFARILNDKGEVTQIVNNFEHISFNIGPTLMSWLERHDLPTYQRILAADKKSCDRANGHGNAIAQVYNHIILPLANRRDKVTQVRWGIADFQKRFGRDPEGMWLAETAVDAETLEVLVDEGIRFIVLAPSQAARCRRFGLTEGFDVWRDVDQGEIDPTQPYRCFISERSNGRNYIDIFFYDGPISGDIGFDTTLSSAQGFSERVAQAVRPLADNESDDWPSHFGFEVSGGPVVKRRQSQIISVATDGETFGHHRAGAEKTLAYAVTQDFPARGWQVTSYAHYLEICPPTWEVQLKPVTAWSCSHGVGRWHLDCGCGGGGEWHQQWRAPLRTALNGLRDRLGKLYQHAAAKLLRDPWAARNDYIEVISDRTQASRKQFFARHQTHPLSSAEQVDALRLLEMQRHTLLMYTSCGWFFEEISRPEGTQILRYAARAIEMAEAVSSRLIPKSINVEKLESSFVRQLAQAPSNVSLFKTGAGVYQHQVKPHRVTFAQIAAHYAMGSLFSRYRQTQSLYAYSVEQLDYTQRQQGQMTLAVGQISITSTITQEEAKLAFAVLHVGGWDFQCGVQAFSSKAAYKKAKTAITEAFLSANTAQTVLTIHEQFSQAFALQDLFEDERHHIMQQLVQGTLSQLNQDYERVYRDNYGVLMAFHREHLAVPQPLQVSAELALSHRALEVISSLEQDIAAPASNLLPITVGRIAELDGIATEAHHFRAQLDLPGAKPVLERLVWRGLSQALQSPEPELVSVTDSIDRLIQIGDKLSIPLSLGRIQELYYHYLTETSDSSIIQRASTDSLICLGQVLVMDMQAILADELE